MGTTTTTLATPTTGMYGCLYQRSANMEKEDLTVDLTDESNIDKFPYFFDLVSLVLVLETKM